jgi:hypothetical protein
VTYQDAYPTVTRMLEEFLVARDTDAAKPEETGGAAQS